MAVSSSRDSRRSAWIVCDDPSVRGDIENAALAAGMRPTRHLAIDEADAAMRDRPDGTMLLVDFAEEARPGEDALLSRINVEAEGRYRGAVVSFDISALDRIAGRLSAPYTNLLCQPTMVERIAAIGFADAMALPSIREVDAIKDTLRLHQIADEVARIARALAGAAEQPQQAVSDGLIGYRAGPVEAGSGAPAVVRADDIRTMIRLRRQRDRLFPADLFADPAWDMMLDLMVARIERLKVAVSSLCIAAAVPPTTALRWIRTLTDFGIFVRVADPTDGRRVFIELSDAAATAILNFLGEAKRTSTMLV